MAQINLGDIRTVQIDGTPTAQDLGKHVPKNHMRHILALKYCLLSGASMSNVNVNIYDKWGTSNAIIDKNTFVCMSGTGRGTNVPPIQWPYGPKSDFAVGHVKESGVASIQTSGGNVNTVMVYVDLPDGRY